MTRWPPTLYGFTRDDDDLVEHPEEQAVLRTIITMTAAGHNATAIAETLNAEGHRTRSGSEWTGNHIRQFWHKKGKQKR